jgi:hypothetical protein
MAQVNRNTKPAIQDKQILPPSVGLEDLSAGVVQPPVDLNHELELAKDHIDIEPEVIEDHRQVRSLSGNAGIAQQTME